MSFMQGPITLHTGRKSLCAAAFYFAFIVLGRAFHECSGAPSRQRRTRQVPADDQSFDRIFWIFFGRILMASGF